MKSLESGIPPLVVAQFAGDYQTHVQKQTLSDTIAVVTLSYSYNPIRVQCQQVESLKQTRQSREKQHF